MTTRATINRTRRSLYRWARILGDLSAAMGGPTSYAKRYARKRAYRYSGKATRRITKDLGL